MNKEELHRRAVKAATQSILRRGYEVIDADWESVCGNRVDLVAEDNGELVFIEVTESEDLESGFLDGNPNQAQKELMAAEWLAASSPADSARLHSLGSRPERDPVIPPPSPAMESSPTGL